MTAIGSTSENSSTTSIRPALARVGEQLAADGADGVLLRGDRHRGEHPRHEAAMPRVLGLVLVDEDVVPGVESFDGHAVTGEEGGGVEAGGEHVVVARQRPEAHLLVVVHGRFVAQPAVRPGRGCAGSPTNTGCTPPFASPGSTRGRHALYTL